MTYPLPKIEMLTERAQLSAGREQTVDVLVSITPPETPASDGAQHNARRRRIV